MSARAMGSATVSFGLVAIPVKLYSTGDSSEAVRFNMVHRTCGTRLQYRYFCPTDEIFVERDEIAKGYEFAKGQYVLFTDEELKALNPEPTNAIDIGEFVPLEEVDPIFFEKSYYLGPDKGGAKPYRLLAEAMKKSGQAAVARYAARGKDYLVLLRPFDEGLIMQQLRYADELRAFSEIPVGEGAVKSSELDLALKLIEQIAEKEFHPERYEDEQRKRTWELINLKVEGEEIVAPPEEAPKAQIIDLMAALKASLGETEDAKPAKRSTRKPAAKKRSGARKAS
ncbi:MAG TPA: Ku protein [Thermoanaerobaculia bacterium]|nr:Ku protein [Thermoanaerobaculia bacterium]